MKSEGQWSIVLCNVYIQVNRIPFMSAPGIGISPDTDYWQHKTLQCHAK